ncbi:hypothetical protein BRC94_00360 [Halobacteriales archaeon QS_5_70_17]|nr:MAG: hypothetical protein BRC94_00360 [Halobacteriales archaeon QS_5_70_17]
MSTPFTERFGVDCPIAQAPVEIVTRPRLAAAVSDAGGLGSLAVTWRDSEATRAAIRETRERSAGRRGRRRPRRPRLAVRLK